MNDFRKQKMFRQILIKGDAKRVDYKFSSFLSFKATFTAAVPGVALPSRDLGNGKILVKNGNNFLLFLDRINEESFLKYSKTLLLHKKCLFYSTIKTSALVLFGVFNAHNFHSFGQNITSVQEFSSQVQNQEMTGSKEENEENWGGPEAFKQIIFIKNDFDEVLEKYPFVLVFFSANWCQHCLRLRKPYGKAALIVKESNLPMKFSTFDINYNPDIAIEKGVVGIPLIKFYKNGKFITNYKGKRTSEELVNFAKNPPTSAVELVKIDI